MSMRVLAPFIKAVRKRGIDPRVLHFLEQRDADARIQASAAIELLRIAVRITGDESLGLAAALETTTGDYGAVEYAAASCSTVREALDFYSRHYFLLDDSASIEYACATGRTHLTLGLRPEFAERASVDFTLSLFYLSYIRWVGEAPPEYEVHFPYTEPPDLSRYRSVFAPDVRLRFDTGESAVVFPEAVLERPLRYSDPNLHALLAAHVRERTPSSFEPSFTGRVRARIREELRAGSVNIDTVASHLAVSRRSLSRRLEDEGTSFKQLLCNVRRACAVRYLLLDVYSIQQISRRLGYSDAGAFHRAFRSWFGQTPSSYRERQKRGD